MVVEESCDWEGGRGGLMQAPLLLSHLQSDEPRVLLVENGDGGLGGIWNEDGAMRPHLTVICTSCIVSTYSNQVPPPYCIVVAPGVVILTAEC